MAIFNSALSTRICAFASLAFLLASQASAQVASGNYLVKNVASGLLLNIQGAAAGPGTPIIEWPTTTPIGNFPNQIWTWDASANTLTAVNPAVGFQCEHGSITEPCVTTSSPAHVVLFAFNGNYIIQPPDESEDVLTGTGVQGAAVTMSAGTFEDWNTHQQWNFIAA